MKIRYILTALLAILGTSSCKEKGDEIGNYSFEFLPRECTQIITLPLRYTERPITIGDKHFITNSAEELNDGAVEAEQFILWVMTGEDDLKELRAEFPNIKNRNYEDSYENYYRWKGRKLTTPHMLALERQLDQDHRRRSSSARSLSSGKAFTNLIPWEYRVTGVKDFRIISLSPLFGLPAETSLNDYFSIYEFKPRQIISSRTKTLLWGYSDKGQITRIGQWLAMSPMAPPIVLFRLKSRPQELPIKTKFVTILETTAGTTLRDTLEVQLR